MDDIQFVLEAPHIASVQKKRPRLVTSCDNCRLKKIKCIQAVTTRKYEACTNADIMCCYRDRERYFAARNRGSVGVPSDEVRRESTTPKAQSHSWPPFTSRTSSVRSISPSSSSTTSSSGPPSAYPTPTNDTSWYGTRPTYPPDFAPATHVGSKYSYASLTNTPDGQWIEPDPMSFMPQGDLVYPDYTDGLLVQPLRNTASVPLAPLLDPKRPEWPNPKLTPHFIRACFDNLGPYFPFMKYDDISRQFHSQSLSPLLANCIAALAVRHLELPEITYRGTERVVDTYCQNAEQLLSSNMRCPSIDVLHSLVLLSWIEYKRNRMGSFAAYAHAALQMALDLGFSEDQFAQLTSHTGSAGMLHATWISILRLNAMSNGAHS